MSGVEWLAEQQEEIQDKNAQVVPRLKENNCNHRTVNSVDVHRYQLTAFYHYYGTTIQDKFSNYHRQASSIVTSLYLSSNRYIIDHRATDLDTMCTYKNAYQFYKALLASKHTNQL